MVTSSDETVMEAKETDYTPIARKTRSHDGNDKKCLQTEDPDPDNLLESILVHVDKQLNEQIEKKKEEEEIANRRSDAMSEEDATSNV